MVEKTTRNKTALSEQVASQIETMIINQELAVGEKLANEFELAEQLAVSRSTIREAMKTLVSKNIVEIRRGRGTYVAENPGLVADPLGLLFLADKQTLSKDLLAVRQMIEPPIASLAALNRTAAELTELTRLCEEIEVLIHQGVSHKQKDMEFHACLARASQNVVVPNLIPIIHSAISVFIDETESRLKEETIQTHRQILKAIAEQDPRKAASSMSQHLTYNQVALENKKQ